MPKAIFAAVLALSLSALANQAKTPKAKPEGAAIARAELKDTAGRHIGSVLPTESPNGVLINVPARGLKQGFHGFHIRETGRCDAPDFKSAGGHFNPGHKQRGFLNAKGPHAGDLTNLYAAENGMAWGEKFAPGVSLAGGGDNSLLRAGGTALVIHSGPDDYFTDPAGDAGSRAACGVITRQ